MEVALGQTAQHVVAARSEELFGSLAGGSRSRFGGRVGFVWLDAAPSAGDAARRKSISKGRPGVLGRADRFVETEPRFAALARRLLGRTWFVEKLAHALAWPARPAAG